MSDYIYMLILVILSPAVFIVTFIFWMIVGEAAGLLLEIFSPSDGPSCDIDPLCHESFVWDKNGKGWIGDTLVIDSQ